MMLKLATKFNPDEAMFCQACDAGFHHAELWTDIPVLADWRAVVERARRYPLEYVVHFPNRKNLADDALENAVALYRELGCGTMVIHQPMHDALAARLQKLCPDISLAIENHELKPDGLEAWAEQDTDLTLDIEHVWKFTLRDAPLDQLINRLRSLMDTIGPKLRHVHLPGYWPGLGEHRPMYSAREMIFPVLSLLAERNFDGFIVSEVGMEYQTPQDLRMDVLLFELWQREHAAA